MSARNVVVLALGLLAGGSFTVLGQACTGRGCDGIEPVRFQEGVYTLDYHWGEMRPHAVQGPVEASLDLKTNTLVVSYEGHDGFVEETWTVGGIDIW